MTEEEARARLEQARRAHRDLVGRRALEIEGARKAVLERYRVAEEDCLVAVSDGEKALNDVLDQRPAHEWEGRRVFRMRARGRSWERLLPQRIEGVVETVRSDAKFADNLSRYSCPSVGAVIVRLLKKDGSPGLKFEPFGTWLKWELADDQQ